jgi:hypothetical protein
MRIEPASPLASSCTTIRSMAGFIRRGTALSMVTPPASPFFSCASVRPGLFGLTETFGSPPDSTRQREIERGEHLSARFSNCKRRRVYSDSIFLRIPSISGRATPSFENVSKSSLVASRIERLPTFAVRTFM